MKNFRSIMKHEKTIQKMMCLSKIFREKVYHQKTTKNLWIHRVFFTKDSIMLKGLNLYLDNLVDTDDEISTSDLEYRMVGPTEDTIFYEDMSGLTMDVVPKGKEHVKKINIETYISMTGGNLDTSGKVFLRFEPYTDDEKLAFRNVNNICTPLFGSRSNPFIIEDDKVEGIKTLQMLMDKLNTITSTQKKRATVAKDDLSMETLEKSVLNYSGMMKHEYLDWYLSFRHEMAAMMMSMCLDVDFDKTDMFPEVALSYIGPDSHKTPDFIIEEENKIFLVEVAVTDSNPSNVYDTKKMKYDVLKTGIEMDKGKPVSMEIMVLSMDDPEDSIIPSLMEEHRITVEAFAGDLKRINDRLKMIPGYYTARAMLDSKMDESEIFEREKVYKDMIELMGKLFNLDNKKTYSLESSYFDSNDRMPKNLMSNSEDKFLNKVKEDFKNFNPDNYYENLCSNLIKNYKADNISDELKNMRDESLENVKEELIATINELRVALAKKHRVNIACPITTGIFAWIAAHATPDDLGAALESLARFKRPRRFVIVDEVVRGPNGKADYSWAKAAATA